MTDAPLAKTIPTTRTHHGDTVVDPYEWMRDKEDPEVLAHLAAENAYAEARTAHLDPLRERIVAEIRGRVRETDMGVPVREGDWWYYGRTIEGSQYAVQCRIPAEPGDWTPPPPLDDPSQPREGEQIVLDANAEAEGHDFFSLGSLDITPDGHRMLFAVDTEGDERYVLRIRDLATGETLPDSIEGTASGAFFSPDGRFVFYSTVDDSWRPDTVWRHEVGTDHADDVRVFHEPDDSFWVGAGLTRSQRYLVIEAASSVTSETRYLDASDPTGEFTIVQPRATDVEYDVDHAVIGGRDWWLITHNEDAPDFQVVAVPIGEDARSEHAVTVVPHVPGRRVEGVDAFEGFLVLDSRREGMPRTAVAPLAGVADPRAVDFVELEVGAGLVSIGASGNPEWRQPMLRVGYTSFVEPATVANYTVATGEWTVLKRQPVLGGYDPAAYAERREWAVAADGTRIPISLVWKRGLAPALDVTEETASWGRAPCPARRCCTATARTRRAWTRASRSPGSRCSTAASSSRSRTCAAAARWVGSGTSRARSCRSARRSPTSSPSPSTSSTPASAARSSSSRRAAARAACSWAPWRTSPRSSSPASSPTCPSSTRSPRSSTPRCRSRSSSGTSGATPCTMRRSTRT